MKVAGKIWKLLVGIKDGLVLILMLMFFGGLYAALSVSPHKDSARRGALLLDLSGPIVEQPAEQGFAEAVAGGIVTSYRLRDIVHGLNKAAADPAIEAVVLDLDVFAGGGQTALTHVGDALARVREAGKPVLAFATGYTDDSYQLAAHASEVWLDPMGAVLIAGPGGNNLYYAGLLDRLGVTANIYRAGAYKSAVEPYSRSDMSPEAREASQALADSLWETWLQDVRQARPGAQLPAYAMTTSEAVQAANGDMAQAALRAGLVDRLGDRTAFGKRVAEIVGTPTEHVAGSFRTVQLAAWTDRNPASRPGGQIGVLTVAGTILDGEAGPGTAGAETVVRNLEEGLESGRIKALVVRIDSPGGSSLASERIRRALTDVKARGIPVVVSFGSVAASGGYWIATAGDAIFAEPSTITGSIGVFGILPSIQGTLESLDIGVDGVRTTPLSGEPDIFRGPSPQVGALIQSGIDSTYRRFVQLVAEARRLPPARVHEIAQGRVWAGGAARQLGLVDRFGSLEDAVAEAARRAELDPDTAGLVWLEPEPGFLASLLRGMSSEEPQASRDAYARIAPQPEALLARAGDDLRILLDGPVVQARCLDCPVDPAPLRSAGSGSWAMRLIGALLGR